jgi:hypothetical protein
MCWFSSGVSWSLTLSKLIAKERLFNFKDDEDLEEALKISIKRAGLRRSLSEVVSRAHGTVDAAFGSAAACLLTVPPEQLEAYVFERGYKEGVSELHVVERVLPHRKASR